jgi:hypothetical protein
LRKFALVISLIACSSVNAESLWGLSEHGMSVEDVAAKYPSAVTVIPTDKNKVKSGAAQQLKIESVMIADESFEVAFYFLAGKLDQVGLSHSRSGASLDDCEYTNRKLIEALRAKYGKELTYSSNQNLGRSSNISWSSGKTSITSSMFAFPGSCNIYINYNQRIAKTSDNL